MSKVTLSVDATKASVDSLAGVSAQAFQGAQQLAALNLQATQATLAEIAAITKAVLAAKSPTELGKLQTAALRAAPRKALDYGLQVKEIFAAATDGQNAAVQAQAADVQAKFLAAIQAALKNAPRSEQTLALVSSAIAAANNARASVNRATKQAADALDANVRKIVQASEQTSHTALATVDR